MSPLGRARRCTQHDGQGQAISIFLGGKFSSLGDKITSSATHTKDFCEKNGLKLPDCEEFFF